MFLPGMLFKEKSELLLLTIGALVANPINVVYSITVGFSPVLYNVDPMSLPSGNPLKCHEVRLCLCNP